MARATITEVRHYSKINKSSCEDHYDVKYSTSTVKHYKILSGAEYFPKSVKLFMDEHEAKKLNSQVEVYR